MVADPRWGIHARGGRGRPSDGCRDRWQRAGTERSQLLREGRETLAASLEIRTRISRKRRTAPARRSPRVTGGRKTDGAARDSNPLGANGSNAPPRRPPQVLQPGFEPEEDSLRSSSRVRPRKGREFGRYSTGARRPANRQSEVSIIGVVPFVRTSTVETSSTAGRLAALVFRALARCAREDGGS